MKYIKTFVSVLLIAVFLLCACGGNNTVKDGSSAGSSLITEGVMTTSVDDDSKPTSPVKTSFPADTAVIFCSFKVAGVLPEDMIKASWYYMKGEVKEKENELLNETFTIATSDTSNYYLAFYLDKPVGGWYKGSYKIILSVNSADKLTVPFNIE